MQAATPHHRGSFSGRIESSSSILNNDRRRSTNSKQSMLSNATHYSVITHADQTQETSALLQLWYPHQTTTTSTTSALSKTPILREVPQVKMRLTRKDRDSGGSMVTETSPFQSLKSAAPSWLREKPSRQKLNLQSKSVEYNRGVWKKVNATCREDGILLIYGEDRALVHSISLKDLSASDIRLVDDSLLSSTNVLGIFSKVSTLRLGICSPQLGVEKLANQQQSTSTKGQPIYLLFPTGRKMKNWKSLLRTFAKPEVYGPIQKGGTHRHYRQVDLKILEAKLILDRRPSSPRFTATTTSSSFANDEGQLDAVITPVVLPIKQSKMEGLTSQVSREMQSASSSVISLASIGHVTKRSNTPVTAEEDDDNSSEMGMTSGPISGIAGRNRILPSSPMKKGGSNYEIERKASDGQIIHPLMTYYCTISMADEKVAQTKTCNSSSSTITWFDKFSLKDLPRLEPIQIEVIQLTRNGKSGVLGTVVLPLETIRRGELMEGWYPIWSTRAKESENLSSPLIGSNQSDEMIGEIKIALQVAEETILPLRKYAQIEEALTCANSLEMIATLGKKLDEDQVISRLVDIYTSKAIIVDRLKDLTEAESASFDQNPALLFRGNTLLTRAVDKYQRLYCKDWLDGCIGSTVRRICRDRIWLEANDSQHHYSVPIPFQDNTVVVESNLDALQRLCQDLWMNIYNNRHHCPHDLRIVLFNIRTRVDATFSQEGKESGIQGVGAFVFLRLICPAITTPHLYGLMGSSPSIASSKTLMLVAKVFLALANQRLAFDKDKEPWLVQANDFLASKAAAYDDFITFVSSIPPRVELVKEPLGDEPDYHFQRIIKDIAKRLPVLHRESLPFSECTLDRPLALAELVSYVVREANAEFASDASSITAETKVNLGQYNQFVKLCCDVEDKTGYYLDRAGLNPEPIDFSKINGMFGIGLQSTAVYTSVTTRSNVASDEASSSHLEPNNSIRTRRATVSCARVPKEDVKGTNLIGQEFFSNRRRLAMKVAPHLKSTLGGRLSLDYDENPSHFNTSRRNSATTRNGNSLEESKRKIALLDDNNSLHSDSTIPVASSTIHDRVKKSWWKKM